MRSLRYALFALVLVVLTAPLAQGALIISIPLTSYTPTATGGTFRVVATATDNHTFNAYQLRLQATSFLGGIALPITMTGESNLIPGFSTGIDPFPNNTIAAVGDQFGLAAFGAIPVAISTGQTIEIAQFSFAVQDMSFNPGEAWTVDFITGNPSVDTGFALGAMNIPLVATGQILAAVPEPSTFALVGLAAAAALRWRRRKKIAVPETNPIATVPSDKATPTA